MRNLTDSNQDIRMSVQSQQMYDDYTSVLEETTTVNIPNERCIYTQQRYPINRFGNHNRERKRHYEGMNVLNSKNTKMAKPNSFR